MPFCTACGQRLDGGDLFCGNCGTTVKRAGEQQPPPPTARPLPTDPTTQDHAGHDHNTQDHDRRDRAEASGSSAGPRWEPYEGPLPLPARPPSVRRAILAVGLPVTMIAAGLVGLLTLLVLLRSDDGSRNLVPQVVVPSTSTTPLPLATGLTPATTGSPGATALPTISAVPQVTATTARQQAREIEALLGEAARAPVAATVASLGHCDADSLDASTAATTIQAAQNTRSDLLQKLQQVPVDRLPDGPALREALRETWESWVEADRNYLNWAQGIASGAPCDPHNPFKNGGDYYAGTARQTGTRFVAKWNAKVAGPLRLVPRQVRDL